SLPSGTLNFARGEASKTIPFSWDYGYTFNISLFNNAGNATFLGGIKDATIIFEDKNQNPIDNSAYFVRQQYRDFLSREPDASGWDLDRKSTRLNSSHRTISYAVFCLKKKKKKKTTTMK